MDISSHERSIWIQSALLIPKVGRKTVHRILDSLPGDMTERDQFIEHLVTNCGSIPRYPGVERGELEALFEQAENLLAQTEQLPGGKVLSFYDFPDRLKTMLDPPLLLHCLGDDALLGARSAAVIGTRHPTGYGQHCACEFGKILTEQGRVVVSGLALGCDTGGHQGCLDGGGRTIAVLAHGLDDVYPPENRGLAERIVREGGLLVSEYAVGVPGHRSFFVDRDRIQAALSDIVIVVQTSIKGGTLHTVGFAEKGCVPVFALEHPGEMMGEEQVQGNLQLLEDGRATPISPDQESIFKALSAKITKTDGAAPPVQGELF
jgi:DNA processing protein